MSDAWGTVIASVVAVVGTIGGIGIGLIVGRRQLADQSAVEHGQWLRGQRQEAYLAFLDKFDRIMAVGHEFWEGIDEFVQDDRAGELDEDPDTVIEEFSDEIEYMRAPIHDCEERIQVLCEPELTEAASNAVIALQDVQSALHDRLQWAAGDRENDTGWEGWHQAEAGADAARTALLELVKQAIQTPTAVSGRRARRS
ncbi:hypothetical protein ACWY4P_53680 (plasmid) [Streptomyces sp. LZ34]